MSYLNNLSEDVERMIWRRVFMECLPHINKEKAHEYYSKRQWVLHDKEQEEKNQYKSYVNSRGNICIERVEYIPNAQTGLYQEYFWFAYELKYGDMED